MDVFNKKLLNAILIDFGGINKFRNNTDRSFLFISIVVMCQSFFDIRFKLPFPLDCNIPWPEDDFVNYFRNFKIRNQRVFCCIKGVKKEK